MLTSLTRCSSVNTCTPARLPCHSNGTTCPAAPPVFTVRRRCLERACTRQRPEPDCSKGARWLAAAPPATPETSAMSAAERGMATLGGMTYSPCTSYLRSAPRTHTLGAQHTRCWIAFRHRPPTRRRLSPSPVSSPQAARQHRALCGSDDVLASLLCAPRGAAAPSSLRIQRKFGITPGTGGAAWPGDGLSGSTDTRNSTPAVAHPGKARSPLQAAPGRRRMRGRAASRGPRGRRTGRPPAPARRAPGGPRRAPSGTRR
jgi:hypothetical protein